MIRLPNDKLPELKWRRVAAWVTVLTAVGSGYFVVLGLFDPGGLLPGGDGPAARVLGAYVGVRSAVLVVAALWLLLRRNWRALAVVLALNGAVQVLDTVLGVTRHQAVEAIGPALFAVALFVACTGLARPGITTPARP
jgi:hypothetical protein